MTTNAHTTITHVFFDIGGVLGTDGWDSTQRAAAVARFGLDPAPFAERHREAVGTFEEGRMTLDEYLNCTVFHEPRPFSRDEFRAFMLAQSHPFPQSIALARELADTRRYRMMTLNNESTELNTYRLQHFGLREIFVAYFSSCWMGVVKPSRYIFERALSFSQAEAERSVFIDDRDRNLDPAKAIGMHTILFRSPDQLRQDLSRLGVTT